MEENDWRKIESSLLKMNSLHEVKYPNTSPDLKNLLARNRQHSGKYKRSVSSFTSSHLYEAHSLNSSNRPTGRNEAKLTEV